MLGKLVFSRVFEKRRASRSGFPPELVVTMDEMGRGAHGIVF